MPKLSWFLGISVFCALGAGCDAEDAGSQARIKFGDEDRAHAEVVELHIPTDPGRIRCTGTVVAPRRVLTAAHCLDDLSEPVSEVDVFVDGVAYSPNAMDIHPDWNDEEVYAELDGVERAVFIGGVDLAVLDFAEDLPVRPARLAVGGTLVPDQEVTLIGFGRDEDEDGGVRQAATARYVRPANALNADDELSVMGVALVVEPIDGALACAGDSGGPLLDSSGKVAGVFSRYASRDPSGSCASTVNNTYISVDPFVPWILDDAAPHQNAVNRYDVNYDGAIAPNDALALINRINSVGPGELDPWAVLPMAYDVNGDGYLSSLDALHVIRHLNRSAH